MHNSISIWWFKCIKWQNETGCYCLFKALAIFCGIITGCYCFFFRHWPSSVVLSQVAIVFFSGIGRLLWYYHRLLLFFFRHWPSSVVLSQVAIVFFSGIGRLLWYYHRLLLFFFRHWPSSVVLSQVAIVAAAVSVVAVSAVENGSHHILRTRETTQTFT